MKLWFTIFVLKKIDSIDFTNPSESEIKTIEDNEIKENEVRKRLDKLKRDLAEIEVDGETIVGVPPTSPVEVLKDKPAGRVGEIVHEIAAPPLYVGVTLPIAKSLVRTEELGLYCIEDGAASLTIIVIVVVELPPELEAVIV